MSDSDSVSEYEADPYHAVGILLDLLPGDRKELVASIRETRDFCVLCCCPTQYCRCCRDCGYASCDNKCVKYEISDGSDDDWNEDDDDEQEENKKDN